MRSRNPNNTFRLIFLGVKSQVAYMVSQQIQPIVYVDQGMLQHGLVWVNHGLVVFMIGFEWIWTLSQMPGLKRGEFSNCLCMGQILGTCIKLRNQITPSSQAFGMRSWVVTISVLNVGLNMLCWKEKFETMNKIRLKFSLLTDNSQKLFQ